MSEWISVKNGLPTDALSVLVWNGAVVFDAYMFIEGSNKKWAVDCKQEDITHWMPLPPPPKETP